jgi:hypothetical protein
MRYSGLMDNPFAPAPTPKQATELEIAPLRPGKQELLVIAGPHAVSQYMLSLTARLAQRGPLRVLDGGNRFNAYTVARELRRAGTLDQTQALSRIRVARAFTCHQVLSLLENTPRQSTPTLVIDLLDTFYDESVNLEERRRLAHKCAGHLRSLSQFATVAVSVRPPRPPRTDPSGILEIIQDVADQFVFHQPQDSGQMPLLA